MGLFSQTLTSGLTLMGVPQSLVRGHILIGVFFPQTFSSGLQPDRSFPQNFCSVMSIFRGLFVLAALMGVFPQTPKSRAKL
jgi:hypothetical protein